MQKLFGIDLDSRQGIVNVPDWEQVRQGLTRNLKTVTDYYQRYAKRIDPSHFLVQLITAMGVPRTLPLDRFYAYAQDRALSVGRYLNMTTPLSTGKTFDGVFYGGCTEILLGHDEDFDFEQAEFNWASLQPIQVLAHPKSDLNIDIPDGTNSSAEDGIAVIAINIPMLLVQYRQWRLMFDAQAEELGESPRSMEQFIYSYPLTNMAYSHLDVAIFNRLYNRMILAPVGESNRRHPFALADFTSRLDQIQRKQLEMLRNSPLTFNGVLRAVPMVSEKSLFQLAQLPDVVKTRQVIWGLVLARLQMLTFLFQVTGESPRIRNGAEVNRILRIFSIYRTDRALRSSLPIDLYLSAKDNLNRILLA